MILSLRSIQNFSYSAEINWVLYNVEYNFEVGLFCIHLTYLTPYLTLQSKRWITPNMGSIIASM